MRRRAVKSYRDVLRAQRQVFGGDLVVRAEAAARTRREFEASRSITDESVLSAVIKSCNLAPKELIF